MINPVDDLAWRGFLDRSADATIFHHPAWLRLLRNHYGYDLHGCCVTDSAGTIVAGLPIARVSSRLTGSRLVSLPFSDVCPPLVASENREAALGALGRALESERQRTGLDMEIHAELPDLKRAFVRPCAYHHLLPLHEDVQIVERNFAKSQVRRGVAKARREGLIAERRTDLEALDAFYALHCRTRARQGVPTQPKRFIRRFAQLFEQDLGFVQLVRHGDHPVAAAVFLTFQQTITYKYGASDVHYLRKRPNNLLFMEVIRWACANGFKSLDFGRTDLDNGGLRAFKASWGAIESPLAYTYSRLEAPQGAAIRNRLMGTVITHSPYPVSRLIGEMLYKHFG